MNLKKVRSAFQLSFAILLSPFYMPHILLWLMSKNKSVIDSDVKRNLNIKANAFTGFLFLLHTNSYFRTLFYFRIGKGVSWIISWYRPGNKYFNISNSTKIGNGMALFHPYSTIINAEKIGDNFSCLQLTTIGESYKGKPVIGDNVHLAANVTVVGNVKIGNNVEVGAGSVVVKDLPDNVMAAGNPARPIREI